MFELCEQYNEEVKQENHPDTQSFDKDSSSDEEHVAKENVVEYLYNEILQHKLDDMDFYFGIVEPGKFQLRLSQS